MSFEHGGGAGLYFTVYFDLEQIVAIRFTRFGESHTDGRTAGRCVIHNHPDYVTLIIIIIEYWIWQFVIR